MIPVLLVDRKSKHLSDLFAQYIFNNEKIYVSGGCTGNVSSIAGGLYSYIFYQKNKVDEIEMYKKIYSTEELKKNYLPFETKWTKPEVDSLLTRLNKTVLSNDNVLPETLREIFGLNKFEFNNYDRVKYFATKYPEPEILATLASFQNKKDLPLLHQNMDKAYYAITQFPDKSFIPELKLRIDDIWKNYYFMDATAAFCSKDANDLLLMIVDKFESLKKKDSAFWIGDGERYDHFYNCLEKRNCAFNDAFLLKMWTEHRMISFSFFQKIKDKHYNEILKGFMNENAFFTAPVNQDSDLSKYTEEELNGYLCPQILAYLKASPTLNQNKSINMETLTCQDR